MTDTNYKLTFNQTLRWQDLRASHQDPASVQVVRLDVSSFNNSNQLLFHIHNFNTPTIIENDKKCVLMQTALVGHGHIEHELFVLSSTNNISYALSDVTDGQHALIIGKSYQSNLVLISDYVTFTSIPGFYTNHKFHWAIYTSFTFADTPFCLAIPLTMSVKK